MCQSISMVSKGVSGVCSGVGMLCGMGAIGCVSGGGVVVGVLARAAYDIGVCSGRSVSLCMYAMRGVLVLFSVCDLWVVCDVLSRRGGAGWIVR